jgi:Tol biopolymer transport system component
LFAQPFDIKALKVTGEATRLADNMPPDIQGRASYSAAQTGILLYRSAAGQGKSQFTWFDRIGKVIGPAGEPAKFETNFDLSPDGKRIAATENHDLRVIEWERNVNTRLTFDSSYNNNMAWSPDGLQIAFSTTRKGNWDIFVKKLSGNEEAKPLLESAGAKWVKDWSKDGRYISYVFGIQEPDLYALPLFGDKKPFPIVQSPFSQDMPRFSYDGKRLAYDSNESGTWHVYIDAFPAGGQKRQISTTGAGGVQPHWRQDGRELYYLALDGKMMAVDISGDSKLEPGIARPLFDTELNVDPVNDQYSVTPDGGRFLILKPLSEAASTPITVVLNWTSLLKK